MPPNEIDRQLLTQSIVKEYARPVLRATRALCAKHGLGHHDTEDVCSEALLGLVNAIETADDWAFSMEHWERFLLVSALGYAKNSLNRLSRRGITFTPTTMWPSFESLEDVFEACPNPMPDSLAIDKIDLEAILDVVDERTQQILVLHHCEGVPLREIAERLDISKSKADRLERSGIVTILQHFRPSTHKNEPNTD